MSRKSKQYRQALTQFDAATAYSIEEAVEIVKRTCAGKFNEACELHVRLGVDTKKSDQTVRSTVVLPHGTGKVPRVVVITKADKFAAAEAAGADVVGAEDVIAKIKEGWSDFDLVVASPDMMGPIGKELGRVLGPRMPNPRTGTVTPDPSKVVAELKAGKIQFRADKFGIIHCAIGRCGFGSEELLGNFRVLFDAIVKARPVAAKGTYIRSIYVCSTMGPAIRVDTQKAAAVSGR